MNESQYTLYNHPVDEEDDSIDLLPLFRALLKKWWLILLISCLLAVFAFLGTKFLITPTYRSSFSVYVNNASAGEDHTTINSSDVTAKKSLASTSTKIIVSRSVLKQACHKAHLSYSYNELRNIVNATVEDNTEIITVTVTTTDPQESKTLADAVYYTASDVVSSVVDGSSMRAYDLPELPEEIYSPRYSRAAILAFAFGVILSCAAIILYTLLDTRIKSQESLEDRFGLVVLGSVPNFQDAFKNGDNYGYTYGYNTAPKSAEKNGGKRNVKK